MNKYLIILAATLLAFSSCTKFDGEYFDASVNGIYFESVGVGDELMMQKRNFADYFLADSTQLVVRLKVVMLGYAADYDRKAIVKSKALDELPMADIEFPSEIILPAGKSSLILPVVIKRPADIQKQYGAIVYLDTHDAKSDFGEGIDGLAELKIVSEETFKRPNLWDASAKYYFGEWDIAKHMFMMKTTKSQTYGEESSKFLEYNVKAVDSLRRYATASPGNVVDISIPFNAPSDPKNSRTPNYKKPYYWTELHDQYLDFSFDLNAFPYVSHFAHAFFSKAYGITTVNEAEYFKATEENLKAVNKAAVKLMMTTYNKLYDNMVAPLSMSNPIAYKETFYTNIIAGVEYEIIQPAQWKDKLSAKLIDAYYGAYSEAKYRFMLKVVAEGSEPILESCRNYFPILLPVVPGEKPDYAVFMDFTVWEQRKGWAVMKELNGIFKQALAASGESGFTFPEVPADPVEPVEPEK